MPDSTTILGTTSDDTMLGTLGINFIYGRAGDDIFDGFAGNDQMYGGKGNDTFLGGAGDDFLKGGSGKDWVDYSASSVGVNVDLDFGLGAFGDAEGDNYQNIEHITGSDHADDLFGDAGRNIIKGGKGADSLVGYGGNDRLVGGGGKDAIVGGSGNDVLKGGGGADVFYFWSISDQDTIVDFKQGVDKMSFFLADISDLGITDAGDDLIITHGEAYSVTLLGHAGTVLTVDDFMFEGALCDL